MKAILLSLVSLLFVSCLSDTAKPTAAVDYTAQNEKEITDYIAANKLTAQKSSTASIKNYCE